jgi:hypothetical protein
MNISEEYLQGLEADRAQLKALLEHNQEIERLVERLDIAICGKSDPACTLQTLVEYIENKRTRYCLFSFDLLAHLYRQLNFSKETFGPGPRAVGIVDHIKKELDEVLAAPYDLSEWIDIAILAFDGAWRSGHSPEQICKALRAKQAKNEQRQWPDWRTAEPGKAIEHVREV